MVTEIHIKKKSPGLRRNTIGYLLKHILQQTRLMYSKYIHRHKINTVPFYFFYLPRRYETPIEPENLFNELKKQYFNRPYWLVIIYYPARMRWFIQVNLRVDRDNKDRNAMIHERRKAMFGCLRCFLFSCVLFCFDTNK